MTPFFSLRGVNSSGTGGMPPPPLAPRLPALGTESPDARTLHAACCTCTVVSKEINLLKVADDGATRLEVYFELSAIYTVSRDALLLAQHSTVFKFLSTSCPC